MADLDHFKVLNDTHGHEAGDRALRVFAQAVAATLRSGDLAGRVGGEEFAMILRGIAAAEAAVVLDRLRMAVLDATAGSSPAFTASFGVTDTDFAGGALDDLMRVADAALYRAKQEGRDRVVTADERDVTILRAAAPPAAAVTDVEAAMHRAARDDDPMDRMSPVR